MPASSVPPSSASAPASAAGADLASLLRAAPARPQATTTQGVGARGRAQVEPDSPPGDLQSAAPRAAPAVTAPPPAGGATPLAGAGSSFGETLAASLSASAASAAPAAPSAPALGPGGTPAKGAKGKPADSTDAKSGEAQSAVASLAVQPLIAGGLAAQASSQGSPQASPQDADAAVTDSSGDPSNGSAGTVAPAVTDVRGSHAAPAPAVAVARTTPPQAAAPGARAPGRLDEDTDAPVAGPNAGGNSSAPISAPFHGALQSALSAATRLDGASQPTPGSPSPGTTNDVASANAALSAAPGATPHDGASAGPHTAATVTTQIHAEVGSTGWANELGTRLHWMASQGIGSASLRLTPEQLGPVEVKISVHQNAASVWFSAAQPDTRTALEQALPRLRELFSAEGLNLTQAGVSDQSAKQEPREPQAPGVSPRMSAARELSATSVTSVARAHQGLIDTYA